MAKKQILSLIILVFLFFICLLLCLFYKLDIHNKELILSYIRIPSIIKAIISGSCLAIAGMFLQTISKNPLSDPYLTGLSAGAGFGIVNVAQPPVKTAGLRFLQKVLGYRGYFNTFVDNGGSGNGAGRQNQRSQKLVFIGHDDLPQNIG